MRFPGFEGEWETKKLGEVCKLITKGTTPKIFVDEGVRYIKIEAFKENSIDADKCVFIDETTHNKELKRSILKEGDILFAIAGATIGKTNIVTKEILPANTNQALAIIRLEKNENKSFILQILKSFIMQKYIKESISVGAQPNLNLEQMNNFQFPYPDFVEQKKIADFLSILDSKIQTQKKTLLHYESLIQKLRDDLLSQKIKLNNDFPKWQKVELHKLGFTFNGLSGKNKDDFGSGKRYIQYKQIFDSSNIILEHCGYVNISNNERQNTVQYGDIFFTISSETPNEIGMSSVLLEETKDVYLNSFCFGFRLYSFDKLLPEFAEFLFRSKIVRNEIKKLAQGSTRYNMSKTEFLKLEINLPSLEEQTKIADFLSKISEKIETEKKILELLEQQKKYFLQNLFI